MTKNPCKKLVEAVIQEAIAVQQIPSPTFEEAKRALYVERRFKEEAFTEVFKDSLHNVYARIKGGSGPCIVVSAHLDTVFDKSCDLSLTRRNNKLMGPGIGDNSLGVAFLIQMKQILGSLDAILPGDMILVANVCEEGTGDLKGMREVFERTQKENPLAYLVLEGSSGSRTLYTRGVGSRRYKITADGKGGHSWNDFGNSSAIHGLVRLAADLTGLSTSQGPKTSFNIGVIQGGTTINTIAQTAYFLLDLRSETQEGLEDLIAQTTRIIERFSMKDIRITLEQIGDRPSGSISEDAPLVRLCKAVYEATGFEPVCKSGSTDANIPFSKGIPAICIGICDGEDVHKPSETLIIDGLDKAIEKVGRIVSGVWQMETAS